MIKGKRFTASSAQIGTSAAALYTATRKQAQVQAATFLNTSAGAETVTVHLVPSGDSASDANMVVKARSINAGESYRCVELIGHWLSDGDSIQALASNTSKISGMIGGIEVTQ